MFTGNSFIEHTVFSVLGIQKALLDSFTSLAMFIFRMEGNVISHQLLQYNSQTCRLNQIKSYLPFLFLYEYKQKEERRWLPLLVFANGEIRIELLHNQ